MKSLRNKKLSLFLAMVMMVLSFTSMVTAFAEDNVATEITPTLTTDDSGIPTQSVNPNSPYIYQGSFISNATTSFDEYTGGSNVSISAVATDTIGNAVSGATIHIELVEYETGNTVATLNISADGTAKVANGTIVSGRHYRFEYTADLLHLDMYFRIRLVSVVF